MSWYGGDFVTKEVTAIAWSWIGKDKVYCSLLTADSSPQDVIAPFLEAYNEANIVTGHYIRGYDLPLISGALTEAQNSPLPPKLASDTKLDLIKRHGLSNSQESLGAVLGLAGEKQHMTQSQWRDANRLTNSGLLETQRRVMGDVRQHKELRARVIELGWLGPPKIWTAHSRSVRYSG